MQLPAVTQPAAPEVENIDCRFCPRAVGDWLDLPVGCVEKVGFRAVCAGIEEERSFQSEICCWKEGSLPFIFQGKPGELAGGFSYLLIDPGRMITSPSIAGLAGWIEVRPFVGQPIVARMLDSLCDGPLRPKVVDIPPDLGQRCLAVSALPVKELFEGAPDGRVPIDVLADPVAASLPPGGLCISCGQLEPGGCWPDRAARGVESVPVDEDQGDRVRCRTSPSAL